MSATSLNPRRLRKPALERPFGFSLRCEALERRDLLAVVQFAFTALVDSVADSGNVLQGSIAPGATITGTFQYNTDLSDEDSDPNTGGFSGDSPDQFVKGSSGAFAFQTDDAFVPLFFFTRQGDPSSGLTDEFRVFAVGDTTPSVVGLPGIDFVEVDFDLVDLQGTAFSSDALPADLNLADFEFAEFTMFAEDEAGTGNPFVISGDIQSLTRVAAPPPPNPGAAAIVGGLYQDLLGRAPTAGESSQGVDLLAGAAEPFDLAKNLLAAPEYRTQLVNSFYSRLLQRSADVDGAAYWLGRLAAGASEQEVLAGIVASDEYFAANGGDAAGFIQAIYTDLLGRAGDVAGTQFWLQSLQGGASRGAVAIGFAAADEFQALLLDDPTNLLGAIGGWYQSYLGRDADAAGKEFWLGELGNAWSGIQARILAAAENLA